MEKIIKKLEDYLKSELRISIIDEAKIIIPKGIDSKIRIEAIRKCINIVKEVSNDL